MSPVRKLPVGVGCDGRPTATPYVATVQPFCTTRSSRCERLTTSSVAASFAPDRLVDNQSTPDPTHAATTSAPIHLLRLDSMSALHVPAAWRGKDCAEGSGSSGPRSLDLVRRYQGRRNDRHGGVISPRSWVRRDAAIQDLLRLTTGGPTSRFTGGTVLRYR